MSSRQRVGPACPPWCLCPTIKIIISPWEDHGFVQRFFALYRILVWSLCGLVALDYVLGLAQ